MMQAMQVIMKSKFFNWHLASLKRFLPGGIDAILKLKSSDSLLYKIILFSIYFRLGKLELGPVSGNVYFDSFGKYFKKSFFILQRKIFNGVKSKP